MLKVALTGSIAAGKSLAARNFAALGAPVFDADAAVRALYAPGGEAVRPVAEHFPQALTEEGGLDRNALSRAVAGDPARLALLEEIVHPLVTEMREAFLRTARRSGAPYAVLDIPLLFETGADAIADRIVVVSAPENIRRARALARPGMTEEKLALMEARQMPDAQKRARADFIVETSGPPEENRRQVERIHRALLALARGE